MHHLQGAHSLHPHHNLNLDHEATPSPFKGHPTFGAWFVSFQNVRWLPTGPVSTLTLNLIRILTLSTPPPQVEVEEDGSVFIDRDGRHFHHVLNYLRDPKAFLPPTAQEDVAELLKEAHFYQLKGLVALLTQTGASEALVGLTSEPTITAGMMGGSAGMGAPAGGGLGERRRSIPRVLDPSQGHDLLFKLILLGDSRVGKTSMLKRFTSGDFSSDFKPTMGVEFGTQTVEVHTTTLMS